MKTFLGPAVLLPTETLRGEPLAEALRDIDAQIFRAIKLAHNLPENFGEVRTVDEYLQLLEDERANQFQ